MTSAIHTEWKAAQATTAHRVDTQRLAAGACITETRSSAVPDTLRRWPRTLDDAYRPPEWRNGVSGPYRRHSVLPDLAWWFAVVLISFTLAVIGGSL